MNDIFSSFMIFVGFFCISGVALLIAWLLNNFESRSGHWAVPAFVWVIPVYLSCLYLLIANKSNYILSEKHYGFKFLEPELSWYESDTAKILLFLSINIIGYGILFYITKKNRY